MPPEPPTETDPTEAEVMQTLPPVPVLDAGVAKFLELTHIGVARKDHFTAFDFRDKNGLRVVLGLTFQHMRETYTKHLGEKAKEPQP